MTPEIKERMEQLRHGIVPEGYKKTSAGIIPNDWSVLVLKQLLKRSTVKNTDNAISNVLTNSATRGIIQQTDFFDKQIANNENTDLYYLVTPGFFVYNPRISVTAPCGPFNRYNGAEVGIMSPLYTVFRPKKENRDFSNYLEHYFSSSLWYRHMYSIANYGVRSDRMNVTINDMDAMPIPIPPISEYRRIVQILSAQDNIIQRQEKLLAEKQLQKKYLMQQLLTGKKRLPGYDGEWRYTELGKISKKQKAKNKSFAYSLVLSNSAQHGIIPQSDQFDREIANTENIDGYYIVQDGFFVYNPRISVTAPCGPISRNETGKTGVMSPLYMVFSVESDKASPDFLKWYFSSTCWHRHMKSVANYGARHDRMNVTDEDFFLMPIPIPSLEEQTAISDVIATSNREIQLLTEDLEQEKQKKKALMQLLLTGIVRVKPENNGGT